MPRRRWPRRTSPGPIAAEGGEPSALRREARARPAIATIGHRRASAPIPARRSYRVLEPRLDEVAVLAAEAFRVSVIGYRGGVLREECLVRENVLVRWAAVHDHAVAGELRSLRRRAAVHQ